MKDSLETIDDNDLAAQTGRLSEDMKSNLFKGLERRTVAQRINGETIVSYVGTKHSEDDIWVYLGNHSESESSRKPLRLPKKDYVLSAPENHSAWDIDPSLWEQVSASDSLAQGDYARIISFFNGVVRVVSGVVVGAAGNDHIESVRFRGEHYDETVQTYFPHTLCYTYRQKTHFVA